jgi:8-oxo-dGTP pyrophosphatase MutT (NUDIX family)
MTKTTIVAKAFLQAEDGTILLLRRSKTDVRRPLQWDIPGGLVEEEEEFHTACAREIVEETGLEVSAKQLQLAYCTSAYVEEELNVCWLIFIAHITKADVRVSYEHDDFRWVSVDEAIATIEYPLQKEALVHIQTAQLLK